MSSNVAEIQVWLRGTLLEPAALARIGLSGVAAAKASWKIPKPQAVLVHCLRLVLERTQQGEEVEMACPDTGRIHSDTLQ